MNKNYKLLLTTFMASSLLTGCLGSSSSDDDTTTGATTQDVNIRFAAKVADQNASCNDTYAGLGVNSNASVQFTDFRLYVHDVALLDQNGNAQAVSLTSDGAWQTDRVALLDFETGESGCANGNSQTNMTLKGKVAAGSYTGITFKVGVPQEDNHQDSTQAPSPLNVSSLFWKWQSGYKHARIDAKVNGTTDWFFHLGSTDCTGDPTQGEAVTCGTPNRPTIRLMNFNAEANQVILDYAQLVSQTDLANPTEKPNGCMSGKTDADCTEVLKAIGLNEGTQRAFKVGSL